MVINILSPSKCHHILYDTKVRMKTMTTWIFVIEPIGCNIYNPPAPHATMANYAYVSQDKFKNKTSDVVYKADNT